MTAYSFKQQFAPLILSGEKRQTISWGDVVGDRHIPLRHNENNHRR